MRGAHEVGAPLLAASFPRTYLDPNRHAGRRGSRADRGNMALGIPAERQGAHRQVAHLAHAGGRAADLCAPACARDRARAHRALSHAVPPLAEGPARQDPQEVRPASITSTATRCARWPASRATKARARCAPTSCSAIATAPPATRRFTRIRARGPGGNGLQREGERSVQGRRAGARATPTRSAGRHSLQIEINKRLYMEDGSLRKGAGFARLQKNLGELLKAVVDEISD